jgi:Cys-tRNA(Pro)/Cys-tRNA(Cys) deacylase
MEQLAEAKTNAMRMLDRGKVPYHMYTYDHSDGKIDGVSVAAKVGQDPDKVFKTLVTKGSSGGYFVFVLPVALELDLKKAARAVGEKSVAMIRVDEINRVTGYIRGGCSPVGMKKQYPTVFDRRVEDLPAVVVSGGRIGTQIEVEPAALLRLVGAATADITMEG